MSAKRVKVSAEERLFMFSSESVNEGHPDKLADQVSDAVLDECLKSDPYSKVQCHPLPPICSAEASRERAMTRPITPCTPSGQKP